MTRTFQNIQLFNDLSVLDNVMMGFHLRRRTASSISCCARAVQSMRRSEFREQAMDLLAFLEIDHLAVCRGAVAAVRPAAAWSRSRARWRRARRPAPGRAGRGRQPERDRTIVRRDPACRGRWRHDAGDRAPHGPGDGHLEPRRRARLRPQDRRGHAREIQANQRVIEAYLGSADMFALSKDCVRAPASGQHRPVRR